MDRLIFPQKINKMIKWMVGKKKALYPFSLLQKDAFPG